MKRFLLALGFLTRIPVRTTNATLDDFAAGIRCYPLVGLVIGGVVAVAGWCGTLIDPWTGALAALVAWVGITGALHLDGLADLTDGLGAAHGDRARLLAVMAEPHVGSFGVIALVLQLLAKLVLLHHLGEHGWLPLVLVPFAARIGPIAWARLLPPITQGLGAAVAKAARPRDLVGWALVLAGVCVLFPALLVTPLLIAAFGFWLRHRLGGINGDAHGAGIELVETGLLVAIVVARGF